MSDPGVQCQSCKTRFLVKLSSNWQCGECGCVNSAPPLPCLKDMLDEHWVTSSDVAHKTLPGGGTVSLVRNKPPSKWAFRAALWQEQGYGCTPAQALTALASNLSERRERLLVAAKTYEDAADAVLKCHE